jgi:hypothetical protein
MRVLLLNSNDMTELVRMQKGTQLPTTRAFGIVVAEQLLCLVRDDI